MSNYGIIWIPQRCLFYGWFLDCEWLLWRLSIYPYNFVVSLLCHLWLSINNNKQEGPTRRLTSLWIDVDMEEEVLRLPEDKLRSFSNQVNQLMRASSASKKVLQSLVGRLSWACQVIFGIRHHLRWSHLELLVNFSNLSETFPLKF